MNRLIPFGHMADTTDEREYEGNISKRRNHRCQCDSGITHGTCPGPANCPYSDHDEEDEIMFLCSTRNTVVDPEPCRYCGITLADPCEAPPPDVCPKAIAPASATLQEKQAEFRRTTICGKHNFDPMTLICDKCGIPIEKTI